MQVLLASHESSLAHDTGPRHPERPARVPAVIDGLRGAGVEVVDLSPDPASTEMIEMIHGDDYVRRIERFCASGGGALDLDTVAGAASWDSALRAAGAGPQTIDALRAGAADLGFVAMRPPGHHAEWNRAMGFCLFNNVAVAAAHLLAAGDRVAIVDWDVHHGNGTQNSFYSNPDVLYVSVHQSGIYPGTGGPHEFGEGAGEGTNLNIGVPGGTGGAFYRSAFEQLVGPAVRRFGPDWILVSAGYDAHASDPLAGIMLLADDYAVMARHLSELTPAGRAVLFLEGGYDLDALEESSRATLRGWLDESYSVSSEVAGSDQESLREWTSDLWSKHL